MRIAVANASAPVIEAIRQTILASGYHELAWLARDGREAVAACLHDKPDLILMDLLLPIMDGVEATRQIMAETPCPILIVTTNVNGRAGKVFEALGAGAFDAVNTPVPGVTASARPLISKLQILNRLIGTAENGVQHAPVSLESRSDEPLVLIGASAGGPAALAVILGSLPVDFAGAMVITQHVDAQFAESMSHWLNERSTLPVRVAVEGERPQAGHVLLSGKDAHLTFGHDGRISYQTQPADCIYRPSIDLFFESAIGHWNGKMIAVVLTGMGRDGARGMKALREAGAFTIAQDQFSSVVFGMPKSAINLGAATTVLALPRIAPAINELVSKSSQRCSLVQRNGVAARVAC